MRKLLLTLLFLAAPLTTHAALTTNLVSYWKFDESSGNAADSVGSNTLTNNSTATYTAGKINNAGTLNGTTQYFSIADGTQSGLDITGDLSISFWMNLTSYSGSTTYVPVGKINFTTPGTSRAYSVEMNITAANKLDFEQASGAGNIRKGVASSFTTGTWYHIVTVYTAAAGTVDFYINGVAQTQQTGYKTSTNNSADAFEVGGGHDGAGFVGSAFPGQLDEVGVWNRTLSSAEVTSLYNSGNGCQYSFNCGATALSPILGLVRAFFIQ